MLVSCNRKNRSSQSIFSYIIHYCMYFQYYNLDSSLFWNDQSQFLSSSGCFSKSLTYLAASLSELSNPEVLFEGKQSLLPTIFWMICTIFFSLLFILFHVVQILTFCLLLKYSSLESIVFLLYLWMIDELAFFLRSSSQLAGGVFSPVCLVLHLVTFIAFQAMFSFSYFGNEQDTYYC